MLEENLGAEAPPYTIWEAERVLKAVWMAYQQVGGVEHMDLNGKPGDREAFEKAGQMEL